MSFDSPLLISHHLLSLLGTRMFIYYPNRIPQDSALLVVSNHRSFMDALVLMTALNRTIRFACHHYMGQVPLLRDIITRLGCFPLDAPDQRQQIFFHQAIQLLQQQQVVGIFPEGAQPMVQSTSPNELGEFHRGFAHLALKAPLRNLMILPVAIASHQEVINSMMPLQILHWFDPSEPLFDQQGWHPVVIYKHVNVLIGRPIPISPLQQQQYRGKQAKTVVADLAAHCHAEIRSLLNNVNSG